MFRQRAGRGRRAAGPCACCSKWIGILGLAGATALVVGQVIAVGIFLTPAAMARLLGSPFWLLMVWLVAGTMALCGTSVHGGKLAARYPEAGGGYVYLREAWGPRVAFLYGWKCSLARDPGITAALATGLAAYLGYLVPLSPGGLKVAAVAAIAVWRRHQHRRRAAGGRRHLHAGRAEDWRARLPSSLPGSGLGRGDWGALRAVCRAASWRRAAGRRPGRRVRGPRSSAFGGWWEAGQAHRRGARSGSHDAAGVDRRRRASTTLVAYMLTSAAFLYLVPLEAVTSDEAFAAQAGEVLFLGRAGGVVLASISCWVSDALGSLFAIQNDAAPGLYYAMSRDGLFTS